MEIQSGRRGCENLTRLTRAVIDQSQCADKSHNRQAFADMSGFQESFDLDSDNFQIVFGIAS